MQEAMFSGLFGALTAEASLAMVANNLANANTPGYKQDHLAFKDTMIQFAHDQIMEPVATLRSKPLFPEPQIAARVRIATTKIDYNQGSMQQTGNPLDLAISGNGFFRIQTPQGEMLSRDGAFCLMADGTLATKQGWPVLGEGGPLVVPQGTRNIHVSMDGRIFADDGEVGALQVVTADDMTGLEKVGNNMYRIREGSQAQEIAAIPEGALINQGYLESANVEVVVEMVRMIEINRQYEAYSKVMQTSNTLDSSAYSRIGRSR